MILRARVVLPIAAPPINDGAVRVVGRRIAAVGRWRDLAPAKAGACVNLGEVVLMPGLINAHCHLDYTRMAGQLPPPKVFSDWLKLITTTKAGWTEADYAASWREGAAMLVRTGTTTVADMEAVPQLLPDAWESTPLRVFSFLEMIGITQRRLPRAILQEAMAKAASLRHRRCRVGLSPHAPYSTLPELLTLSAQAARRRRWPLSTHVAESALEYAMFHRGEGEMFDWLARSGRDMSDCSQGSPVQHLARHGLLSSSLVVAHGNYLGRRDAALLAKYGVHVAHCPRSHFYFKHHPFPLERLSRAGVNVCLGTDSLASVYKIRREKVELSMFAEMQTLASHRPNLSPRRILQMATLSGARALGYTGRLGQLSPGAQADLIAVPVTSKPSQLHEALVHFSGHVSASLIDGQWAVAPEGDAVPGLWARR